MTPTTEEVCEIILSSFKIYESSGYNLYIYLSFKFSVRMANMVLIHLSETGK